MLYIHAHDAGYVYYRRGKHWIIPPPSFDMYIPTIRTPTTQSYTHTHIYTPKGQKRLCKGLGVLLYIQYPQV